MNSMRLIIKCVLLLLPVITYSQKDSVPSFYLPNTAYNVGEVLRYDLKYGFVKGGEASMVVDLVPVGYSFAYHFKTELITTGMTGKLATVYDIYESYTDILSKFPLKAIRNVTENNYTAYNEAIFDRDNDRILSVKSGVIKDVPDTLLDIISILYYARNALFKAGKEQGNIPMSLYFDEEIYPLSIHYVKTEKINTNFGRIEALLFMPIAQKGSIFAKEDELKLWISNDLNYLPIKIWAKLPLGTLKIELQEVQELKNEILTVKDIRKNKRVEEKDTLYAGKWFQLRKRRK